jgi:hypothetical protein
MHSWSLEMAFRVSWEAQISIAIKYIHSSVGYRFSSRSSIALFQSEERSEPGDAHRRLTLCSPCSRGCDCYGSVVVNRKVSSMQSLPLFKRQDTTISPSSTLNRYFRTFEHAISHHTVGRPAANLPVRREKRLTSAN